MAPRREPDRSVMRTRDRRSWGDGPARGAVSRLGQRPLAGERQAARRPPADAALEVAGA